MEQPLVINNREELIFMLSEAAQLEHMLLCEYLFAAFSLKSSSDEGLTADQLVTVARWERLISLVATQEMLHLALVNNMLTAIGGAPYLTRPNFPQRAKYFPPGVQLALLPFGTHALQHFLYLERPEGMTLEDAPEFALADAPLPVAPDDAIVPTLEEFATVGHLYRGIEHGFRTLAARYGEQRLFIGPVKAQATTQYFGWPELIAVTDVVSATTAIESIVEEGEGARGDWTKAHYGKFLSVFQEYKTMLQQDPGFVPARPVTACVVRLPADADEVPVITDPVTARVANLFNASYEVMLQVLNRFFIHAEETDAALQTLSRTAAALMVGVIKPLGQLLTTLPLGAHAPGRTAGPSFEIYRTGYVLPHRAPAWIILHERLGEIADGCAEVDLAGTTPHAVIQVAAILRALANDLARHLRRADDHTTHTDNQMRANATVGRTMTASFAQDIRPLFRDKDIQSMSWTLDLSSYTHVKANAERIYARLSSGTMPCDGAWPPDRLAMFKGWMDGGCLA